MIFLNEGKKYTVSIYLDSDVENISSASIISLTEFMNKSVVEVIESIYNEHMGDITCIRAKIEVKEI